MCVCSGNRDRVNPHRVISGNHSFDFNHIFTMPVNKPSSQIVANFPYCIESWIFLSKISSPLAISCEAANSSENILDHPRTHRRLIHAAWSMRSSSRIRNFTEKKNMWLLWSESVLCVTFDRSQRHTHTHTHVHVGWCVQWTRIVHYTQHSKSMCDRNKRHTQLNVTMNWYDLVMCLQNIVSY